jgi:uncharacterized membrane protein
VKKYLAVLTLISFFVLSLLTLSSCRQPGSPIVRVGSEDSSAETANEKAVPSFALIRSKVLSRYCLDCHDGSRANRERLNTFAEVTAQLAQIKQRVFIDTASGKRMPPQSDLSASARALLDKWINAGAPEIGSSETVLPPEAKPTEISWSVVFESVISPRCVRCHYEGGLSDDGFTPIVNLKIYDNAKGSASATFKYAIVKEEMPPAPTGTADGAPNPKALTTQEKQILSDWIVQGMKP